MNKLTISRTPKLDFSAKEALNTICTNILFSGKKIKKVMLTSCVASEGKSTMTGRILFNMAERGRSCVLVDADLRKSVAINRFGIRSDKDILGLAHYLSGQCEMEEICYRTNYENVYIVPAGRDVSNPIGLINTQEFRLLLDELAEQFDVVIVDTPPVGVVIDAVEISSACDGVVMVIEYGKRHRREVQDAVKQMERSGTPILGCIIDMVKISSFSEKKYYRNHYYNNYYQSGYYNTERDSDGDEKPKKSKKKRSNP